MCSHNFAPTSDGPGIADLPWVAVAPISFAYSGLMVPTAAVERVASCQTARNTANSATETIAARKWRLISSRRLPDLEAGEIIVRLLRIERAAHHRERLVRAGRRRQPHLGHQLPGVGGEIDLFGDRLVIDIALDLDPALH